MLIRFSVENFKSFNERVTMDTLSTNIKNRNEHKITCGSENLCLLRIAMIYGGNAAGKSNIIDAINFTKRILNDGIKETSRLYCRTNEKNKKRDSIFNFEFCIDKKYYMYGFSARLFENRIVSEWLYSISSIKKVNQELIFEREINKSLLNYNDKYFNKEEMNRLSTYEIDFGYNDSLLFLGEMVKNKSIGGEGNLKIFADINKWFGRTLKVIKPDQPIFASEPIVISEKLKRFEKIISTFDTGIELVDQIKITKDELDKELFENIPEKIASKIYNDLIDGLKEDGVSVLGSDSGYYIFEYDDNKNVIIKTVILKHNNKEFYFKFNEESDGTKRIFDLINILLDDEDSVYIIDELDRSLHPKVTRKFLEMFIDTLNEKNVQLIFTTHESNIMTQDLIRRDEVWFVERNYKGESTIFPLRDFKDRYDRALDKAYLEGRYGGLPILKNIDECEVK